MSQLPFRRKLLLTVLLVCSIILLGAWAFVAATICTNPRTPVPQTQQVIPYNCHGMTVYLSSTQNLLLYWLFPVFALFSLAAAVVALSAVVKMRINVNVHVNKSAKDNAPNDSRQD